MARKAKGRASKAAGRPTPGSGTGSLWTMLMPVLAAAAAVALFRAFPIRPPGGRPARAHVASAKLPSPFSQRVPCHRTTRGGERSCSPGSGIDCGRMILDGFITDEDVERLRGLTEKALAGRGRGGGPAIVDLNTGYIRDTEGLVNIYAQDGGDGLFTAEEYGFYGGVIDRIRAKVSESFGLDGLHFTAPTFITRSVASAEWQPRAMHDIYWMPHVDKNNTQHYDWSGLLYLSTGGEDFEGGDLIFYDEDVPVTDPRRWLGYDEAAETAPHEVLRVVPRRGRLAMFSAGAENPHRVTRVEKGERIVLSMWFTCDERRRFKNFLDGKAHDRFEKEAG